jgi:ribosomal protein S18 acetylase RimI-like enzyme
MEVVSVTGNNVGLLQNFIDNIGESAGTFRYFAKRDVSVIKQHIATLLFTENDKPVAYGHLEREGDEVWLGVCVLPGVKGKGYGKQMMNALIQKAEANNVKKISLTVDKVNKAAVQLYEKLGFKKVAETDSYFKYEFITG